MGVFIQPPFWAVGYRQRVTPHVVSVLVTPPSVEPFTRAEAKLRAGQTWADGDDRDAMMDDFIAAARAKVELDTGMALLTQTRDLYLDAVGDWLIRLPVRPLASVTSIKTTDSSGAQNTLDPTNYVVDVGSARIGLSDVGTWPTDLRSFQPWVIRVVAGYPDVATLKAQAPLLRHAVGLLIAHYATLGRDLATADGAELVPQGYEDAIAPYVEISVV